MNIILGIIGFLLIVCAVLFPAYMVWRSRGIRRRRLSQDKIVRATVVTRLRNLSVVVTLIVCAFCCFLLAGLSTMVTGTADYASRETAATTLLITGGILLALTLGLYFLSRLPDFNFMQVTRGYAQRRKAIMNKTRAMFRRKRRVKPKSRV